MKIRFLFLGLLLFSVAAAQQKPAPSGSVYGVVITSQGERAKRLTLAAMPLDGAISAAIPHTKTNDRGEYRFEDLPSWGRYSVYADDEDVGYSIFVSSPSANSPRPEVELRPEQPEAELKVYLPPKAGFLHIHVTNRRTGETISAMQITLMLAQEPARPILERSSSSSRVILIPPDKDLLLHVISEGFQEWEESIGMGKPIQMISGTRMTLDVQLEPL